MESNYPIFRKYQKLEYALETKKLLEDHKIHCEMADNAPIVDVTFAGNTIQNLIEIRIPQEDFEKAEKLLENEANRLIEQVDKNHYLYQFSEDELYEILLKKDEWSAFDYQLAQKILKEKGKTIDEHLLAQLSKQRMEDLAKPESSQKPWVIAGYILAFLGGAFGIITGYFLWTSKKTLPNGTRIFSYQENDRKHGKIIFFLGLVILITSLIVRWIQFF